MNRPRPPHFPHRRRHPINPDALESLEDRMEARSRARMDRGRDLLESLTDAEKAEVNRQVAEERARLEAAAVERLDAMLLDFTWTLAQLLREDRERTARRDLDREIAAEAAANL